MSWWQIGCYAKIPTSEQTKNLISHLVERGLIKNLGVAKELVKYDNLSDEDKFLYSA